MPTSRANAFEQLMQTAERLRAPGGCPWDREQTHESLRRHLLEETYELLHAIERWADDPHNLAEELGDLLLQVVLHSVIAAERGAFTIEDVIVRLNEKLIRRHPHVFGEASASTAQDVAAIWQVVKEKEKAAAGRDAGEMPLPSVPEQCPPLAGAYVLQAQARAFGFDWDKPLDALAKVREELDELQAALEQGDAEQLREEAGDSLFALVNVIRLARLHPDDALAGANQKFARRFAEMTRLLQERGLEVAKMSQAAWDRLWNEVKEEKEA